MLTLLHSTAVTRCLIVKYRLQRPVYIDMRHVAGNGVAADVNACRKRAHKIFTCSLFPNIRYFFIAFARNSPRGDKCDHSLYNGAPIPERT